MTNYNIIGLDMSKNKFDIFCATTQTFRTFDNTNAGIGSFLKLIKSVQNPFVILEPTGGYERLLTETLAKKNIAYARINPYQTRSFARSIKTYAKTDKIDAKMLSQYGEMYKPKPDNPLSNKEILLQDLLLRRRQLVENVRQEKCRLDKTTEKFQAEINEHLAYLARRIKEKDIEIKELIESIPNKKGILDVLLAEPGVGEQTAFVLLAEMPELGLLDGKKIAALAGVAPIQNESGLRKKETHIKGGRRIVRSALYMAAVVAVRFNPKFKRIYNDLRLKGKKAKVALTAVMRRLLVVLNAKVRDFLLNQKKLEI